MKIYTEADWKAADGVDRLYLHLLEPDRWELTYAEEDRLDCLRKVWAIMCKTSTPRARIKLIMQHIDVTERTVYVYINDATALFGDMLKVDLDTELALSYARFMKLYDKAKSGGDYETARRCQDNALAVLDKIEARSPKDAKKYATLTFTDNPAALSARNEGELIEFEDVEAGVLELQTVGVSSDGKAL